MNTTFMDYLKKNNKMSKNYNLGCTDYYGRNDEATETFNNKLVPFLKKKGLKDKDIDEVFSIIETIVDYAEINAANNRESELNEYS